MTKEEMLNLLQEERKKGITYKGIALAAGIRVDDIYGYINRKGPGLRVHAALEKYFMKGGDQI